MTDQGFALVLLAAGRATRFGDVKQLARVGPSGEALMDYTVYDAGVVGFSRVVVVTSTALLDPISRHVSSTYGAFPVEVVVQDGAPVSGAAPGLWGTGHAVLAAAPVVTGPFAVCNADDYYGRAALAAVRAHLGTTGRATPPLHCVAGYRLAATLADSGGVSRAVCEVAEGYVTGVAEVRNAVATSTGVRGELTDGTPVRFGGDEAVSMNLWGFQHAVFAALERQFTEHVRAAGSGSRPEFYLSDALGQQIRSGAARLSCLRCPDEWFGMTYADDLEGVRIRLAGLVSEGYYPPALAGSFSPGP